MNAVDQLCTHCGLCCDSTLFADVELRAGDDPKRLARLGLPIKKKGIGKFAFAQPCACFDGKFCNIYHDRPKRCYLFECGLLKKVQSGEMNAAVALKKIAKTKKLARSVRDLLCALDASDEKLSLMTHYARAMEKPVDLSDATGHLKRQGALMQSVRDLMEIVQRDFLR